MVFMARATLLPLVISVGLCGCGSTTRHPNAPAVKATSAVDVDPAGSTHTNRNALRAYLRVWQASWGRLGTDLRRGGDDVPGFSSTPDASWDRARRYYGAAAAAYRRDERRLAALSPPAIIRRGHDAYLDAVRRQAARFQSLSDAFGGTDPQATEQALETLENSQMSFDLDGVQWERAVIAACKASGVEVPEIVRREYISNGHRTAAR
jgi:hypothetical protein